MSPDNWVVGRRSFPFGMAYFQGIMLALGRLYPKKNPKNQQLDPPSMSPVNGDPILGDLVYYKVLLQYYSVLQSNAHDS